ncbi:hypothetical protein [Agromyces aureus]|uniref:Uncharacterized protein n=1 Tax=Agromyces aureus TaxID=453304 RepID=A0A191WEW5_9MICO|nr:hypothetical protein [Agromyces aureus]ANJ26801.1 hypothetical protein ATC03_08815 [Agromyces aureus]
MTDETEYTPTTEEIREAWVIVDEPDTGSAPPLWIAPEFDRWLAEHDAEVAAKALEDAIAFIDASPAVTWTGKGGVKSRLVALRVSTGGENHG